MIDRYTRDRFEAALPHVTKHPVNTLWNYIGLVGGEHCYAVPVKLGVIIYIRSTVESNGLAADTAKDSIRCWLAADQTGAPLGSKNERPQLKPFCW